MTILTRKIHILWANPYITDGLVAHWDGIWNSAPGKHDAGAATIHELITGYDLSTSLPLEIGENYFRVKADNRSTVKNIDRIISAVRGDWTVEIVGECRHYDIDTAKDTNVFYFNFPKRPVWSYVGGPSNNRVIALTTSAGCHCLLSDRENVISSSLTSTDKMYGNGGTGRCFSGTYFREVGNHILSSQGGFKASAARIHCIRIYSRILSADEVYSNYLVDKLRFGVP